MSRVWSLVRAARRLTGAEWRELLEAQLALLVAQLLVWRRPTGRLITQSDAAPLVHWGPSEFQVAERAARAINRAARHGIVRPQCLVRALALTRLLESRGLNGSTIRIGVRWDAAANDPGTFVAHAWVVGGAQRAIVGDSISNTAPFSELTMVRTVRRSEAMGS